MAFRILVILVTMMVANTIAFPGAILQPTILAKTLEPADAPAKYSFSYQVNDPTTGDIKSQEETRDGDVVKGSYTLIDADGLQRVVHYTSDGINGFNAIVSRTPLNKQIAVKAIQPALIAAPLAKVSNSPFGHPLSPLKLGPLY